MKKILVLVFGLCTLLSFTSCKSSESVYKEAYEKAKQQELAQPQSIDPVDVTPVVTNTPVASAPVVSNSNSSTIVREEKVTVVTGSGLKDFSVVCGSFGMKANADRVKAELDAAGYNALVVHNAERGMYRVIVSTHDDRNSAAQARDTFKARYASDTAHPDYQNSWLLYNLK